MSLHRMEWPYYYLDAEGHLRNRDTDELAFNLTPQPVFISIQQAEQWLADKDERGNVTEQKP